jgi:hypothetical protein
VVWRDGRTWTVRHRQWVVTRSFDDPAVWTAYAFYLGEVTTREVTLEAMEAELRSWLAHNPFADAVARLSAYRGIDHLGALGLAAEICEAPVRPCRGGAVQLA